MKEHEITQPVILIGTDLKEAKGFSRVVLIEEDITGLKYAEKYISGVVYIQLQGETLKILVKPKK
jgi:hypothetical protein